MKLTTPILAVKSKVLIATISLLFIISFSYESSQAQNSDRNILVKGAKEIKENPASTIPNYVTFNDNERPSFNSFEQWFQTNMKLSDDFGMILISEEKDLIGFTHYRYRQTFRSLPVSHTMLIVHVKDNQVVSFNGEMISEISGGTVPTLSENDALTNATNFVGAKSYKWQIPEEEAFIKREQGNSEATFFPNGELMFAKAPSGEYKLAYRFDIYAHQPVSRKYVYVDANTAEILSSEDRIHDTNTTGTAITAYCGSQSITTDYTGSTYRLRETTRGLGVETYNMHVGTDYGAATDFTDADNTWNNVNVEKDQYATDAHFGAQKTYDYFYNSYGRNSIDNAGFKLLGYVHANLVGMGFGNNINAFWDGSRMTYGDGGSGYNPLTSMDIAGHEITHGLTEFSANLIYAYECGALNEGFSDIFGTVIEFYATPNQADWLIGEDIGAAFRSMSNPNTYGHPDTYRGTNWYYGQNDQGGVHSNSGVLNYWFYLLTQGGTGTNDLGLSYNVSGIGMTKAAAIAFRTLTVYLTIGSQYADARFYAIKSAEDLFGVCSAEAIATAAAWYAVGVGSSATGVAPNVVAVGGATSICIGSSITLNASPAANYQWYNNSVSISGATNSSYAATTTGNYSVSTNYCNTNFTSSSISLSAVYAAVVISSNSTLSCNGSGILLSASYSQGYNLQWKRNGVAISGATSFSYTATQSGNYTATITGTTVPSSAFSSSGSVSIPNYTCSGVNNTITVSGLPTSINPSGISLFLNITHPHDSDLVAWLENPAGDKLGLAYMNGGNTGANYTNTTFADAAFEQLPYLGAPFTGTYKPMASTFSVCGYTTNKTSFGSLGNGSINPNGTWRLRIVDIRPNNSGTLNNWQLNFPAIPNPNPDCGPVTSNQLTITISNAVTATITPSGSTTFCQGGSVNLSASSGASYNWSTGATTQSITVTTSGTFSVTVTNISGCSGTTSATTTVNPLPSPSITGNTTFCSGSSTTLNAGAGFSSYNWSTGATTQSITVTSASTFSVTVTNANSCSGSTSVTTTINPLPTAATISAGGPTTFCSGGSVLLSGNNNAGVWSVGGGTTSTLSATTSGDYFVTNSNACGSTTSNHIIVTVNPLPSPLINGNTSFCNGSSTTLNAGSGFNSYSWSTGATTQTITVTNAATFSVTVTNANSCSGNTSGTTTVNANPTPSISGNTSFCSGSSTTLNAGSGYSSYNWSTGATSQTINVTTAATFSVTVTNANSCSGNTSATTTVNPLPMVTANNVSGCAGSAITLSGSPAGGTWSVANPYTGLSTTYTHTYTNANGCSNTSAAANITVNPLPTVSFTGLASTYVVNAPPATLTGSPVGGTFSGAGISGNTFTPASAGVGGPYTITYSYTNANGCSNSSSQQTTVTSCAVPVQPGNISGPISVCHQQNNVIYSIAAVPNATSYTWTVPTGAQIKSGQGTTTLKVKFGNSPGNITVKANNSCGSSPLKIIYISMPCKEDGEFIETNLNISIYPNPSDDDFTISFNASENNSYTINIFDVMGRKVEAYENISSSKNFRFGNDLVSGIYFAEVISSDNREIIKLIKQE